MNRKEKIDFINTAILPQMHYLQPLCVTPRELLTMIEKARVGRPIDQDMTARVDDGFLFINGAPAGRIAPRIPRVVVTEDAEYWEGRCLAASED